MGACNQRSRLGMPRFPQKKRVDIATVKGSDHLRRLQKLHFDPVNWQVLFFCIASEVVMAGGGAGVADRFANQILGLFDLRASSNSELLPAGDHARSDVQLATLVPT